MAIVRWDPFGETMRMQRDMDRIFARLGERERGGEGIAWMPKIDVKRSGDDVTVRAELPGLRPEDVDIELRDNVLTISGERTSEEQKDDEGWLIRETSYGSFERSLTIPDNVDPAAITATFMDGVLEVRVPRAFEQSKPRTTKIEIGAQQPMQMGPGAPQGAGEQPGAGRPFEQYRTVQPQGTGQTGATETGTGEPAMAGQGAPSGQPQDAEERETAVIGGRESGDSRA